MGLDGLLVIDKPVGPTSHDVVACVRRLVRERVGHTGTLDPMASGVLPMVVGRATRLARFLSADDKEYEAVIRLGVATDTYDAMGQPVGPAYSGPLPPRPVIEAALDAFRGTFLQQPPAFSAKRVEGVRSYRLARSRGRAAQRVAALMEPPAASPAPALPSLVSVSTRAVTVSAIDGERLSLTIACSGGFYVRSLAHDLGAALGIGAHLVALRRIRSGGFGLESALALDVLENPDRGAASLRNAVVPVAAMLPALEAVTLDEEGIRRVAKGREIEAGAARTSRYIKLLDRTGTLLAVAEPGGRPGLLHPVVVLM